MKFANSVSFCIMHRECNQNSKCDYTFPRIIQKYTEFANFTGLYFLYFVTKLHHFTKFRMLFLAVLINIPNSKVCVKGESIVH